MKKKEIISVSFLGITALMYGLLIPAYMSPRGMTWVHWTTLGLIPVLAFLIAVPGVVLRWFAYFGGLCAAFFTATYPHELFAALKTVPALISIVLIGAAVAGAAAAVRQQIQKRITKTRKHSSGSDSQPSAVASLLKADARQNNAKMKLTQYIHLPTLTILSLGYLAVIVALWLTPHNFDSPRTEYGKMALHQGYANVGKVAGLGLIDRTLVDWYMSGRTEAENTVPASAFVRKSVLILTPVFAIWVVALSWLVKLVAADNRMVDKSTLLFICYAVGVILFFCIIGFQVSADTQGNLSPFVEWVSLPGSLLAFWTIGVHSDHFILASILANIAVYLLTPFLLCKIFMRIAKQ